ncbi:MAG: serine carboxypeptidase, partial [Halioglobus sp.]|nr:serine carboxypeptidase [Halioglobus sp.]
AYLRTDTNGPRPVTFVWNGGPGAASLWLHMGAFGPKRVVVPSDAEPPGLPPYPVENAVETILDVTDLVFVDPVGTGYSRALGEHEGKEFWGLNEDAQSIAEFIRSWVTDNHRWNAPRFLLGESYGTTRAAAVADLLESDFMMRLNGVILISQALDYAGSSPYVRDNLISHVSYLPTMAAAASYHHKVVPRPDALESFLVEARQFASDVLLPALWKGNALTSAERSAIVRGLQRYTGLSAEYIERANLRVQGFRFAKELLRSEGKVIGLLDARYTVDEVDDLAADPAGDAADSAVSAAFKSALMEYLQADLKVDWARLYLAPADENLNKEWNWRTAPDGEPWEPWPINTAHKLSHALSVNPDLRVLVAAGYFDLVTPFFDAEFTLNRHDIDASRIDYRYYHGGHMMYVNEPSRTRLLDDTRQFMKQQLEQGND